MAGPNIHSRGAQLPEPSVLLSAVRCGVHRMSPTPANREGTAVPVVSLQLIDRLHRALITAPVLVIPDPSKAFILDTDTSNDGVGAVLSQVGEQGEKVVAYTEH
ncbi:hypothetical protein AAFF_G00409980 [Aldrovandia affinis]|uniref:Reverse transcriptase/retrotransposon-derived protein RNase H-like domain-containing protein n=1 Tax=Aldrovandia affinis TaxID=143900 RepID=A0AAD7SBJ7_9TELE|nr:hypothetical protein AAFF_G00409980 [Aldrovandia affinis]